MTFQQRIRFPLIALGMFLLITAVWGGLLRISWDLPFAGKDSNIFSLHGPLMVAGFLGTLISLERAVALDRLWGYAAPLLIGVGGLATVVGVREINGFEDPGRVLMTLGSLVMVLIFVVAVKRQPEMFMWVMALGTVSLFIGNVIWTAQSDANRLEMSLVLWWAGFLIFTIAGERLELSRMLQLKSSAKLTFFISTATFLAGLVLANWSDDAGMRVAGAGMVLLTAWLLKNDIARRTVKMKGLTRFISVCLLTAYVWLGVAGVLALATGDIALGTSPYYADAILHAVFLGFTFSMIFGHAPIIFPAVLGLNMTYRPFYYVPLVVLDASLVLRVATDLAGSVDGRKWGAMLNGVAIAIFLVNTVYSVVTTKMRARARAA